MSGKYAEYIDRFLQKTIAKLQKQTDFKNHIINLKKGRQLPYKPIFSLRSLEVETLTTYIRVNLMNKVFNLFLLKLNGLLRLYIDYQNSNNFIIKNSYLLPLIEKSLDCFGYNQQFI